MIKILSKTPDIYKSIVKETQIELPKKESFSYDSLSRIDDSFKTNMDSEYLDWMKTVRLAKDKLDAEEYATQKALESRYESISDSQSVVVTGNNDVVNSFKNLNMQQKGWADEAAKSYVRMSEEQQKMALANLELPSQRKAILNAVERNKLSSTNTQDTYADTLSVIAKEVDRKKENESIKNQQYKISLIEQEEEKRRELEAIKASEFAEEKRITEAEREQYSLRESELNNMSDEDRLKTQLEYQQKINDELSDMSKISNSSYLDQVEEDANYIGEIIDEATDKLTTPIETDIELEFNDESIDDVVNDLSDEVQSAFDDTGIDFGDDFFDALHSRDAEMQALNSDLQSLNATQEANNIETERNNIVSQENVNVNRQNAASRQALDSSIISQISSMEALDAEQKTQMVNDLQLISSNEMLSASREKGVATLYKEIAELDEKKIAQMLEIPLINGEISAEDRLRIARIKQTSAIISETQKSKALAFAQNLAKSAAMGLIFVLGSMAISAGLKALDQWINKSKYLQEAADEAADAIKNLKENFEDSKDSVNNIKDRYAELAQGVNALGTAFQSQGSLSFDEYKEFLEYSNKLAELFPELTKNYDENGNAILDLTGNVDGIVKSLDNLIDRQRQLANNEILENMPAVFNNFAEKSLISDNDIDELKYAQGQYEDFIKAIKDGGQVIWDADKNNGQYLQDLFMATAKFHELESGVLNKDLFNMGSYVVDNNGSFLYDFSTLHLTPADMEYIERYANSVIANYNQQIKSANNNISGMSNQLLDGVKASLSTNFDYLAFDDETQKIADELLSSLDFKKILNEHDIDSWDDMSTWINDNIIYQLGRIDDKAIQDKMASVINGSVTGEQLEAAYQSIIDYLVNTLGITEGAEGYEMVIYWTTRYQEERRSDMEVADHLLSQASYMDKNTLYSTYLDNIKELSDAEKKALLNLEIPDATLYSWDELMELIHDTGDEIDDTAKKSSISDSIKQMEKEMDSFYDQLGTVYNKLFEEDGFTRKNLTFDELSAIRKQFEDFNSDLEENAKALGIAFDTTYVDKFLDTLTDASKDSTDVKNAFHALATEWFYSTDTLKNLNDETRNSIELSLKQWGVTNASDILDFGMNLDSDTREAIKIYQQLVPTLEILKQKNDELIVSKEQMEKANRSGKSAVEDEVDAVYDQIKAEAIQAGVTEQSATALFQLALAEQKVNLEHIDTSQDVAQILAIAEACGIASDKLLELRTMKTSMENIENAQKRYDQAVKTGNQREISIAKGQLQQANQYYDQQKKKQEEWREDWMKPLELPEIQITPPKDDSRDGGGGGSDKEEDPYVEQYKKELEVLDWLHENKFISEKKYLDQSRALYMKYFKDREKYSKEYAEAEAKYTKAVVDMYNSALTAITGVVDDEIDKLNEAQKKKDDAYDKQVREIDKTIEKLNDQVDVYQKQIDAIDKLIKPIQKQIDAYEEQKDNLQDLIDEQNEYIDNIQEQIQAIDKLIKPLQKQINAYEKEKKAIDKLMRPIQDEIDALNEQKEAIDKQIKPLQKQIDAYNKQKEALDELIEPLQEQINAIDDEIEKLQDANDAREKAINLEKDLYNLRRAENQRTNYVYKEGVGFTYENDASAVRDARETYNKDLYQQQIDNLNKEKKSIQDVIDGYNKEKDALDKLIKPLQKQIDLLNEEKEAIDDLIEPLQDELELYEKKKAAIDDEIEGLNDMIESYEDEKEKLEELKEPYEEQIKRLEKEMDAIDKLIKPLQKQVDAYEKQKKAIEELQEPLNEEIKLHEKQKEIIEREKKATDEYYGDAIKGLEEYKKKYEELQKLEQRAGNRALLESLGFNIDSIKNMDEATFEDFKKEFMSALNSYYQNEDGMLGALFAENGGYSGKYLENTADLFERLEKIDLTSFAKGIETCNGEMQTFLDTLSGGFGEGDTFTVTVDEFGRLRYEIDGLSIEVQDKLPAISGGFATAAGEIAGHLGATESALNATAGNIKSKIETTNDEIVSDQIITDGELQQEQLTHDGIVEEELQHTRDNQSIITSTEDAKAEEANATHNSTMEEQISTSHEAINKIVKDGTEANTRQWEEEEGNVEKATLEHNERMVGYVDESTKNITSQASDATKSIQNDIDSIHGKEVTIKIKTIKETIESVVDKAKDTWDNAQKAPSANAKINGTAFADGTIGNPKASNNVMIAEVAPEMVVDPHTGEYTIYDTPTMLDKLPKNSIVFNGNQTKELIKNGATKKYGKAYAGGRNNLTPLSLADPEKYALLMSFNSFADAIQNPVIDMSNVVKNSPTLSANPVQNVNVNIGDIKLTGVQDVNSLSKAIVNQLPTQLLQEIHKR